MASVDLKHLWLHNATDLADNLSVPVAAIESAPSRPVQVREYAGGRQRAITRKARPRVVNVELRLVPRDILDQIEAWLGETLLLRDPRGRKLYGVIGSLDVTERAYPREPDVSFSFREVSDSEEV